MLIAVIILGIICIVLLALVLRRPATPADTQSSLMLKQDLAQLSQQITHLKDGLQHQLTDRMDKSQELMRDSMQRQFSASSKLIADVTERLTKLDETNKRVVHVADELRTLQNVLQN